MTLQPNELDYDFDTKALLEIETREGHWTEPPASSFRSWGGKRRINGEPYNGPVYFLWSNEISKN